MSAMRGFLLALLVTLPLATTQAPPVQPEYLVKAKVLRILAEYVVWPASKAEGPIVLGVLGESSFGSHLDAQFAGRKLRGREIRIAYAVPFRDLARCDILFICRSESGALPTILMELAGKPVFTLADNPEAARKGVMTNLTFEGGRVRFEVNRRALKAVGLDLSSFALQQAVTILD